MLSLWASRPRVPPMYAPVRALAPPRTPRVLDGQVNQIRRMLSSENFRGRAISHARVAG